MLSRLECEPPQRQETKNTRCGVWVVMIDTTGAQLATFGAAWSLIIAFCFACATKMTGRSSPFTLEVSSQKWSFGYWLDWSLLRVLWIHVDFVLG
jgi:hypothetical protein